MLAFLHWCWEQKEWLIPSGVVIVITVPVIYYGWRADGWLKKIFNKKPPSSEGSGTTVIVNPPPTPPPFPVSAADNLSLSNLELIRMLQAKEKELEELRQKVYNPKLLEEKTRNLETEIDSLQRRLGEDEEIIAKQKKERKELEKLLKTKKEKGELKTKALQAVQKGNYKEAEDYLKQFAKESINETSATFYELGKINKLQLEYREALKYFELAANIPPPCGEYLHEAGVICFEMGLYDKAEEYFTKEASLLTEMDTLSLLGNYNNMGIISNEKGNFDKAIEYLNKALQVVKNKEPEIDNRELSIILNNLCFSWIGKGNYQKAIKFSEDSLKLQKEMDGHNGNFFMNYINLAEAWRLLENNDKALEYLELALSCNQKFDSKDHPNYGYTYTNLAAVYASKKMFVEARQYIEKAIEIEEKNYGENYPGISVSYYNLASINYQNGDYESGKEYCNKGLSILKKAYKEDHPDTGRCQNLIGLINLRQGNYDNAVNAFTQALAIYKKFFPEEHAKVIGVSNNLKIASKKLSNSN